ncbi:MerR family transcriptional regulator [Mycolicibacterium fortuitum]|uniref:DNA-binding protein n=2 Tax=Mycolicibacterium fortuitum TaxID=1766 RepID=A0AAE4VGP3_MYCFO|nr:hypothetical protein [Mycolicibacterium fortuitum]MCV7137930.1 DNA-binding protein [Mycolicibacterium fortuitum]MDV7194497.1 DNA-binding protein [Mycolicibacterium fortuitum]MDV7207874.1 DNA-binding protein [Mycolicibacterium fortuitum]MDV7229171.1 DNA-binding protein [Mycolicibacterium fortuitum]MDV7260871.1 DNA-binding protein [Mycolicibacterium fortuitum]
MDDLFKLGDAAKLCGVRVDTLRMLIADGLLPAARTSRGDPLLPTVPTWQQCRELIEQQRDVSLQRAGELVERIGIEVEAVGNDIAEARENPLLPLGVDLTAANSQRSSDTTLAVALSQLNSVRMQIVDYDRALKEMIDRERF